MESVPFLRKSEMLKSRETPANQTWWKRIDHLFTIYNLHRQVHRVVSTFAHIGVCVCICMHPSMSVTLALHGIDCCTTRPPRPETVGWWQAGSIGMCCGKECKYTLGYQFYSKTVIQNLLFVKTVWYQEILCFKKFLAPFIDIRRHVLCLTWHLSPSLDPS